MDGGETDGVLVLLEVRDLVLLPPFRGLAADLREEGLEGSRPLPLERAGHLRGLRQVPRHALALGKPRRDEVHTRFAIELGQQVRQRRPPPAGGQAGQEGHRVPRPGRDGLGVAPVQREDLPVGEPEEDGFERRVAGGEVRGDVDGGKDDPEVLDLAAEEEPFPRGDDVRYPRGGQRVPVAGKHLSRGVRAVEDGDVPQPRGALRAVVAAHLHGADDPSDKAGKELRLVHLRRKLVQRHRRPLAGVRPVRVHRRVRRREVLSARKDAAEQPVQRGQQVRPAAEVAGERHVLPARRRHLLPELPVHLDVRAAEAVDRLLRVPHDEQPARRAARRQHPEDLRLERVGVLELIHEDVAEPRGEPPRDFGVRREERLGPQQQVHEIEPAPLRPLVRRQRRARPGEEEAGGGVPRGDFPQHPEEAAQVVPNVRQRGPVRPGVLLPARAFPQVHVERGGACGGTRRRGVEVPAADRLPYSLEDRQGVPEPLGRRLPFRRPHAGHESPEILHARQVFPQEVPEEIGRAPEIRGFRPEQVPLRHAELPQDPPYFLVVGLREEDPFPLR